MPRPLQVDPRGLRVAAALTSVVLAVALLSPRPVALVLLAAQAVVFAIGASGRLARSPYAWLFARLVRPRIGPPAELEDARPPRFAQGVGLGFTLVASSPWPPAWTRSASWRPASRWSPPCSTPSWASASAARRTWSCVA